MNFNAEIINRIELLISSVGIILGFFFGSFLILKRGNYLKTNVFLSFYLLVFSLRMAKSLFYNYYPINPIIHTFFLGSLLTIGPSLWFYSLHLRKHSCKNIKYFLHYLPFIFLISFSWIIPYNGRSFFYLGIFFHGLIYCLLISYKLIKDNHRNKEGLEKESKIRQWLLLLNTLTIVIFLNSILIFLDITSFYPTSAFLFSISVILLSIYALNNLWLFTSKKIKYSNSNLNKDEANQHYDKLKKILEEDKLYLDTELSLTKLSKLIGVSPKQLSQIINQTEKTNYSQYITAYRVEEAKILLKDPNYSNYKISAIAYESGFNSISSFNSAFKKTTKTTAIKFREL